MGRESLETRRRSRRGMGRRRKREGEQLERKLERGLSNYNEKIFIDNTLIIWFLM